MGQLVWFLFWSSDRFSQDKQIVKIRLLPSMSSDFKETRHTCNRLWLNEKALDEEPHSKMEEYIKLCYAGVLNSSSRTITRRKIGGSLACGSSILMTSHVCIYQPNETTTAILWFLSPGCVTSSCLSSWYPPSSFLRLRCIGHVTTTTTFFAEEEEEKSHILFLNLSGPV